LQNNRGDHLNGAVDAATAELLNRLLSELQLLEAPGLCIVEGRVVPSSTPTDVSA